MYSVLMLSLFLKASVVTNSITVNCCLSRNARAGDIIPITISGVGLHYNREGWEREKRTMEKEVKLKEAEMEKMKSSLKERAGSGGRDGEGAEG